LAAQKNNDQRTRSFGRFCKTTDLSLNSGR
jgi:hypothetical protein